MPRRKVSFKSNNYYHIYNRGVNSSPIFFEDKNYLFLIKKVNKYRSEYNISVIAYCLMPNHYHFLLSPEEDDNLSSFVQSVFNSYTKAANKKYDRKGTLFESRFKASHVDKERYLIHLCSYIHRNPINAGLTNKLGNWPYSNLPEWLEKRSGKLWNQSFRNKYFNSSDEYLKFLRGYNLPSQANKYLFK